MRRGWFLILWLALVVAIGLAVPSSVWAADPEHGGEKPNIFDPRSDLFFWTIIVFVLLLLVLKKWAWGPMLQGLQRREQNIQLAIDEAQRAREEAQRMREQWQAEIDRANDKVREIMDAARRDAENVREEMLGKTRRDIQAERDRLHREIETARDQALQEIWTQTAQLATLISAKAIRRELSGEDHRRLVDEALAELRQAAAEGPRQGGGLV
jgi:F-type H+-transporting ATPase subunit b